MTPAVKLASFALLLVVAFGIGSAIGTAVGPVSVGDDPPMHHDGSHG